MNISEVIDITETTINNDNYRWVFSTTDQMQLVFMSLLPNEEIGMEIHPETTQFIRIEQGHGYAIIDGEEFNLKDDVALLIPPGTKHNIINTGDKPLKLYSIYSPPHHQHGLIEYTNYK